MRNPRIHARPPFTCGFVLVTVRRLKLRARAKFRQAIAGHLVVRIEPEHAFQGCERLLLVADQARQGKQGLDVVRVMLKSLSQRSEDSRKIVTTRMTDCFKDLDLGDLGHVASSPSTTAISSSVNP